MEMNPNQEKISKVFEEAFGRTPLKLRIDDVMGECLELHRHTDMRNLKEETGDLLCSLHQLATECDWSVDELIAATLEKIERRRKQYKSLGRKVKVALLGGAFDPIHDGHVKLAQFVLNTSKTFDEVWFVPAFEHMNGKDMSSAEHRLAMCELAVQVDGRLKVFPYEIEHGLSGETFHFVTRLLEEKFAKDEYDFSMIIGQDNANSFDSWVNFEHLEKAMRFVVVSRQGEEPNEADWYLQAPHICLKAETAIPEISSTDCRTHLGLIHDAIEGEECQDISRHAGVGTWPMMLEVMQYAVDNGLYVGCAKGWGEE